MAQIPPNIENNPQNKGFVRIPTKVGSLAGKRYIPQVNKKQPNIIQKCPKIAVFFLIILMPSFHNELFAIFLNICS